MFGDGGGGSITNLTKTPPSFNDFRVFDKWLIFVLNKWEHLSLSFEIWATDWNGRDTEDLGSSQSSKYSPPLQSKWRAGWWCIMLCTPCTQPLRTDASSHTALFGGPSLPKSLANSFSCWGQRRTHRVNGKQRGSRGAERLLCHPSHEYQYCSETFSC